MPTTLGGRQAKPLVADRQVWDSSVSGNGRADLAQGGEAVLSELRGVFSNVSGKPVSEEDILNLLAQSGIPTADLDCLVQGDNMEKLAEDLADVIMEHDVASDSLPEGDAVSDVEEPSLLEDEMKSGGNKVRDYMKSLFDSLRRFVNPGEIAESDVQARSEQSGRAVYHTDFDDSSPVTAGRVMSAFA